MKGIPARVYVARGAHHRQSGKVIRAVPTGLGPFYEIDFFAPNGELSGKRDLVNAAYCKVLGCDVLNQGAGC